MRRLAQRHLDAPLGGGGDGTSNLRVASQALLYVLSHTPPMGVVCPGCPGRFSSLTAVPVPWILPLDFPPGRLWVVGV